MRSKPFLFALVLGLLSTHRAWGSFPMVSPQHVVLGGDAREAAMVLINHENCELEYVIRLDPAPGDGNEILYSPRKVRLPARATQVIRFLIKNDSAQTIAIDSTREVVVTKMGDCQIENSSIRWAVAIPVLLQN